MVKETVILYCCCSYENLTFLYWINGFPKARIFFTSTLIQNELIEIMASKILQKISSKLAEELFSDY